MSLTAWSIALRDIPHPDYADASIAPIGPDDPVDPAVWARTLFGLESMPRWVVAALHVRQLAVRLIGIPPAPRDVFQVRERVGDEVLIAADDTHLDFRCGVAIDERMRLLRVTTTVRFNGWRGRVYFVPVRLAHPIVVRAMIRGARRSFARAAPVGDTSSKFTGRRKTSAHRTLEG
ncbi:DUF2867 domain-containing protein [Pseudolysinimonas yzui]|uniref:DUF2867 domain-containing protein n=1 Tax=Pseudolysinimonas yzui TaxID=2708254 RepID=A0A8J3GRI1_9MICO|nr:DUF2867 domain-containing protein [Pseudolysinimonas yzui]GHF20057.1 hypothetical protein GCM10011600_21200 [Pseudolysinimonas yzui]